MSLVYILPISNLIFLCWDFKVLARPRHVPSFLLKLKKENRKVLLVAADTFRAAAVEQLKILGGQVGVPVFSIEGEKILLKLLKRP